jgi:hypothetical protein
VRIRTLVILISVAVVGLAPNANAAGAIKGPLVHYQVNDCFTGEAISEGTPGEHGSVAVRVTGDTTMITVSLKRALPNTVYEIDVYQVPSGFGCQESDTSIRTNSGGNAMSMFQYSLNPDTTAVAVLVINFDAFDYYQITRLPV